MDVEATADKVFFEHFQVPATQWVTRDPIVRGGVHQGWLYVHSTSRLPLAVEYTVDAETLQRNAYCLSMVPEPTKIRASDAALDEQIPETVARNIVVPLELAQQHVPTLLDGTAADYVAAMQHSAEGALDEENAQFMYELFMLALELVPEDEALAEKEAQQRGPSAEQQARRIVKGKRQNV